VEFGRLLVVVDEMEGGIEERLSNLRRDYGDDASMRHLDWAVIASNLHHVGQHLAA